MIIFGAHFGQGEETYLFSRQKLKLMPGSPITNSLSLNSVDKIQKLQFAVKSLYFVHMFFIGGGGTIPFCRISEDMCCYYSVRKL